MYECVSVWCVWSINRSHEHALSIVLSDVSELQQLSLLDLSGDLIALQLLLAN